MSTTEKQISIDEIAGYFSRTSYDFATVLLGPPEITVIYVKQITSNYITRKVTLIRAGEEVGYFEISGKGDFKTGAQLLMSINIDDEEDSNLRGKNLSRLMIGVLVKQILKEIPDVNKDQLLEIDADGGGGFWERIGMYTGRYSYMSDRPESVRSSGEKQIEFGKLSKWALDEILGSGGKKSKKSKKFKKSKKSKKSRT